MKGKTKNQEEPSLVLWLLEQKDLNERSGKRIGFKWFTAWCWWWWFGHWQQWTLRKRLCFADRLSFNLRSKEALRGQLISKLVAQEITFEQKYHTGKKIDISRKMDRRKDEKEIRTTVEILMKMGMKRNKLLSLMMSLTFFSLLSCSWLLLESHALLSLFSSLLSLFSSLSSLSFLQQSWSKKRRRVRKEEWVSLPLVVYEGKRRESLVKLEVSWRE